MGEWARRFGALVLVGGCLSAGLVPAAADDYGLDQNWTRQDRLNWYELSQGSRLMPLSWFLALEQAGSQTLLLDDAFVSSFGYIPHDTSTGLHLPLGFAVDTSDDTAFVSTKLRWKDGQGSREPWVGMNCAGCHSNEIRYNGHAFRIEGGPTMADFQGFMDAVDAALVATRKDPAKWRRFAARILGSDAEPVAVDRLAASVDGRTAELLALAHMSTTEVAYGPGRLDAFGHIFNKIIYATGTKSAAVPADAPVSYPYLWNVPQHEWVQWDGVAENVKLPISGFDIGALGRNAGEVIGVFGELVLRPRSGLGLIDGYVSSLDIANLAVFERQLQLLKPPAWPAALPPIDPAKQAKGAALYAQHCQGCHQLLSSRDDLTTKIPRHMGLLRRDGNWQGIGTDPWMACNAYTDTAETGSLEGVPIGYAQVQLRTLEKVDSLAPLLATAVGGALLAKRQQVYSAMGTALFRPEQVPSFELKPLELPDPHITRPITERAERLRRCMSDAVDILGYRSRPLNGIWATAPYLHDGSVPTLYDLLKPAAERPKSFYLGSREFDPVKVGYVTGQSAENRFLFETRDASGRPLDGNANAGHDFGFGAFSDEDRFAIIEYLKSL
ncbi:MAG: di-heme-cytochrome C peroxidase [Ancalomicrobiaceae bacterium]|nr:di-heme-cytochrome C peroxidase [Ancalomicrobiaceae bacterium]